MGKEGAPGQVGSYKLSRVEKEVCTHLGSFTNAILEARDLPSRTDLASVSLGQILKALVKGDKDVVHSSRDRSRCIDDALGGIDEYLTYSHLREYASKQSVNETSLGRGRIERLRSSWSRSRG
jgi:hypothetical protein